MSLDKYVGVWFQNSWAIVPRKLIFDDCKGTKCYWPNEGNVEELARVNTNPNRRSWDIWRIEKPEISHGNYV